MSQQLQTHLIAAAIGATIGVISAASIFIYQKVLEKQHTRKTIHLDEVNRRLTEIQAELERLRTQQNQQRKKKLHRKRENDNTCSTKDNNDTDVDFSTAATDVGDDEFFDCSDSENGISDIENRATEATYLGLDLSIFDVHYRQEGYEENDYLALRNFVETYSDNIDIVWRYGRICYKYSNCITDPDVRKDIILAGINASEKLLIVPNADLHKWCAILIGVYSDFLPIAEKIKNGYRFKEHVINALEITPNDADLHHMLGRFNYEVANLGWIERKVAATLFSEPPSASYEDAIDNFQKAEKFATEINLENQLFLSKCYIALGKYELACDWLEKICESSITSKEDEKIQIDARELFNKYSGYRV